MMGEKKVRQILNQRDLEILIFLEKQKTPSRKTEIYRYIEGNPNRIKDNLVRLKNYNLITQVDGKKVGCVSYKIIEDERIFIKNIIKKFNIK